MHYSSCNASISVCMHDAANIVNLLHLVAYKIYQVTECLQILLEYDDSWLTTSNFISDNYKVANTGITEVMV